METFALNTIENGGAIGVLFVIFLLESLDNVIKDTKDATGLSD